MFACYGPRLPLALPLLATAWPSLNRCRCSRLSPPLFFLPIASCQSPDLLDDYRGMISVSPIENAHPGRNWMTRPARAVGPRRMHQNDSRVANRDSSCAPAPALAGNAISRKELLHRESNFYNVRIYRKLSGIEELNLRARYVLPKRFGSRRNEKRIILAPDRKQRRLRLPEIFLESRIQFHIRCVIQKQIELNLFVSRLYPACMIRAEHSPDQSRRAYTAIAFLLT